MIWTTFGDAENQVIEENKMDTKQLHDNQLKEKILIVDDAYMHLETAKLYLEVAGFEVFCASDTGSAWRIISEEAPDLVLLDVVMPGVNGLELLSEIKSHFSRIEVVIMTAFGSEEVAVKALKLGAVNYIKKPFRYSNLNDIVDTALAKQREVKNQDRQVKSLQHAYEKLQVSADSILQCMSAGVVAVDNGLCIRMVNQRAIQLTNRRREAIIGEFFYIIFPIFQKCALLEYTLQNGKGVRMYEVEIQDQSDFKVISINTDVIYDLHGNKLGAVATFEDITDLRRKEEMLRDRERLAIVGQMAAGMAHEIKNPLTAIKGFAQILSTKKIDQEFTSYLKTINLEIDRMNQVIQDFLQLARPKALRLQTLSIHKILLEMVPLAKALALMKKLDVQIKTDKNAPDIVMDSGQIKQVILNLCQNAIEAMEDGGILTLETSYLPEQGEVCLNVRDTGCGIPHEKIKEIGVPFYTTKADGTGLGLSICFSIVNKHKGRIEIKSEVGCGTAFSVYLPAAEHNKERAGNQYE